MEFLTAFVRKTVSISILAACASSAMNVQAHDDVKLSAYYGDKLEDRVVAIDVDNMAFKSELYTQGQDPYPVDAVGKLKKLYAITRDSQSVDIIDTQTNQITGVIPLPHKPRSAEAFNESLGLQLINGADHPMVSIIDVNSDTLIKTVGDYKGSEVASNYGGTIATGHPFWFNDKEFALIDRTKRQISVYRIKKKNGQFKVKLMSTVDTPTSVHHLMKGKNKKTFFALGEGSQTDLIAPQLIKYKLKKGQLTKVAAAPLTGDPAVMGTHHTSMHPDGIHAYVGSTEGILYIVDTKNMRVVSTTPVGKGAGHTTFVEDKNIAIITNHKDRFLSIIDTYTHQNIKNVLVSDYQQNGAIYQSHTSFVDKSQNYFYAFASDNGFFYELDLNTLTISRELYTGGTPLQGSFMCNDQSCK